MPQNSVRYNVRWGSGSKTDGGTLALEKCEKYKRKLLAALQKNKGLAQKNKKLVQALEAAKAKITELEADAGRQLKIDSLHLPRLKAWLDESKGCTRALLENLVRSTKLLQDILTPEVDITLAAAGASLQDDEAAPEPRPSLHPPGSRYCDQDISLSMVLEEDEEDRSRVIVMPLQDSTEPLETEPELSRIARVTVRKKSRHSDRRRSSLPDELCASLDQPLGGPAFAVLDEGASSLVTEITGQEKNIVRAEKVVVPPPDKLKGHSADEYSAAFSHRPKIPRTPSRHADREEGCAQPAPEDACSSPNPKQRRLQPCRVSEIPLLPWPRQPDSTAQGPLNKRAKEFGSEATNTSLLSSTGVLDEAFVEFSSPTEFLKKATPSPERVGDCWGDENGPPEAKVRRSRSILKSPPSDSTKPKASRMTFVVKKRGRSQMPGDDGAADPMDYNPALPKPDDQGEQGCGDRPRGVDGTMTLQCPAALSASPRHRASLTNQQRGTTDKSRGKKLQRKRATGTEEEPVLQPAALSPEPINTGKEEEPVLQPAAFSPEPIKKQTGSGKYRGKKLQGKRATGTEEEPVLQPAALSPEPINTGNEEEPVLQPAALSPEPIKKQTGSGKSRGKKLQEKRATGTEEEPVLQPAALSTEPINTGNEEEPDLHPAALFPEPIKKQTGSGKSWGKKFQGKRATGTEEEPVLQPAALSPEPINTGNEEEPVLQHAALSAEPIKKQTGSGKPRGKKLQGKRTAGDMGGEPAPKAPAAAAKPDAPAPEPAEKQPGAGKSQSKKPRGSRIAGTEAESTSEPAAPACLPSPPPCVQHSRPLPKELLLDAVATSSAGNMLDPQSKPSGRPSRRTASTCSSYKLPSLNTKMRRP